MFSGRRVVNFCAALVVGIMTWGIVGGVSAAPILSAAGSPTTTIALANTTTTTVRSDSPTTTVKGDSTTTIPARDLCPNIAGVQTTVPAGFFVNAEGNCVRIVDLCPNIVGVQATIPTGMFVDHAGNCVPRIVDLCPNITGVQLTVPAGMIVNASGDCVPPVVDLCPNIAGVQATIPTGMFVDHAGNCVPRIADLCPNIIGVQATVPAGFFVNHAGNCVVDFCVLGGTGPGGGIVFYVASSAQPWGRCLEAAPKTWNGGTADPFVSWGCPGTSVLGAQGVAIGTGQANTNAIVVACTTTGIAARLADNLVFGGKSDWFLPSVFELAEMYYKRAIIGGLGHRYWSSSEIGAGNAHSRDLFGSGTQYFSPKGDPNSYVRPIRAIN